MPACRDMGLKHSREILRIVSTVFGDVDETLAFDISKTELEDDLLVNEWEELLEDDELLNLAADNIFHETQIATGYHELSQLAEDSLYEENVSDASIDVGIPDAINDILARVNSL